MQASDVCPFPFASFSEQWSDRIPGPDWSRTMASAWAGMLRGEAFRRAEVQDEEDRRIADRSPCGIHLYPEPCDVCWVCGASRLGVHAPTDEDRQVLGQVQGLVGVQDVREGPGLFQFLTGDSEALGQEEAPQGAVEPLGGV